MRSRFAVVVLFASSACASSPPPPSPPPPAPIASARVGSIIPALHKTRDVAPIYPVAAIESRVEGVVIVEARIGTDGRVSEVRILRSIQLLDDAALNAVRQWEFEPVAIDGIGVVPTVVALPVAFKLP